MQGPLINKRQFERVVSLVDSAKKSGVKVVTGVKFKNIPAVQTKVIKGCVNLNYAHATFGHVYLDCIVHFSPLLLRPGHHLLSL